SPLAVEATHIFRDCWSDCYDEEARELVKRGVNPLSFSGLKLSLTTDESRAINFDQTSKVIISASGMCEAGRIRHHLKHNLWRPENTVLFVGYQANGTLGRALVEGVDRVRLFGETIEVRCQIRTLSGVSGHADNAGLLNWASAFEPRPKKFFVVHGEDSVTDTFAERLSWELGCP
ncbi:metallo-beta-lactamase family protein, partial [gut metagenome]